MFLFIINWDILMAQARQVLTRINSVKNTQKITRAMKMVAAAKLNRAQGKMDSIRPYSQGIAAIFSGIASNLYGDEHPLLRSRERRRVLSIVIAGDRGLCGGFNNNVLKEAKNYVRDNSGVEHVFFAVGKRAIWGLNKTKIPVIKSWYDVFDKLSFILSGDIAKRLIDLYLTDNPDERIDEVNIIYNKFISRMAQVPIVERVMPLNLGEIAEKAAEEQRAEGYIRPVYSIEPSPAEALTSLVTHYVSTEIYHAVIESYAAELAARMAAMDSATNSADEMIDSLTLLYNRARQAGITAELLDIVGGANALG